MPVLGEMLQCASLPVLLDTVTAKMSQLETPAKKHRRLDGHIMFDNGFRSFFKSSTGACYGKRRIAEVESTNTFAKAEDVSSSWGQC